MTTMCTRKVILIVRKIMSVAVEKMEAVLVDCEGVGYGVSGLARVREAFTEEVTLGWRPEQRGGGNPEMSCCQSSPCRRNCTGTVNVVSSPTERRPAWPTGWGTGDRARGRTSWRRWRP